MDAAEQQLLLLRHQEQTKEEILREKENECEVLTKTNEEQAVRMRKSEIERDRLRLDVIEGRKIEQKMKVCSFEFVFVLFCFVC